MTKKEKKTTKKKEEELTLASAFEKIYEEACKELNVTHFQSIMLAILANYDEAKSLNDMSNYTKCPPIRFLIHKGELDDLHYRHFVQWSMTKYSLEYRVRDEFMKAVINNTPYTPKNYKDYTAYDVYTKISKWIEMLKRDGELYDIIIKSIKQLLGSTRHLTFSKDLLTSEFNDLAIMVILITVKDLVENNSEYSKCQYLCIDKKRVDGKLHGQWHG